MTIEEMKKLSAEEQRELRQLIIENEEAERRIRKAACGSDSRPSDYPTYAIEQELHKAFKRGWRFGAKVVAKRAARVISAA